MSVASADYESGDETEVKLTHTVRNQYLQFLEKKLKENLEVWQEKQNKTTFLNYEALLHDCLRTLEEVAIEEAIIAKVYQREMLKLISKVRQNTKEYRLEEHLERIIKKHEENETKVKSYTKATQTEHETEENWRNSSQRLSLEQRIDLFQNQLNKDQGICTEFDSDHLKFEKRNYKRRRICKCGGEVFNRTSDKISALESNTWHSPSQTPPVPTKTTSSTNANETTNDDLEDDEIAQELDKIFTEEEIDFGTIFGITSEKLQLTSEKEKLTQQNKSEKIDPKPFNRQNTPSATTKTASNELVERVEPVIDLRYSVWPCERFMQRRRLSLLLNRLVEEDIRWYDIIKWKFTILFGEDDDNEFAPCSPSIELDQVLISSCVRRISSWVVKYLMKPLSDGLIGNRFLFKKLAKKLAHSIILENQYPDENFIKCAVENFFCAHSAITSLEDLKDMRIDDF